MSKGKSAKPWSDKEIRIMRYNYRNRGAKGTMQQLHKAGFERSLHAVSRKARNLKLFYDPAVNAGLVFLHEAMSGRSDPAKAAAHDDIVRAAKEDGVLSRSETYPHQYMAPEEWVDQYVERKYQEKHEADALMRSWLSSKDVADLFEISMPTLYSMISPARKHDLPLRKSLLAITRKKVHAGYGDGLRYGWYWKPDEAKFYATQYKKRRAKWRPSKYQYG